MAAIWFSSLKRSLKLCKAELSDIVQQNPNCNDETRKPVLSRLLSSKSRRSLRDDHGIQGRRSTQAEPMEISHILDPITESGDWREGS
ncbi:putative transcription factor [Corchorus olitorius]|uniref:Transcription factor n=1 Tax=Corchorus olitorius TaxID=93759 RepID=A0A1R3I8V7_9ROSI|nr:putative transcription factor [Corchorus olitorius]